MKPQVICSAGNEGAPHLRLLHYNDVYHVDPASAEPVGGLARFVSVCKSYREGKEYQGQPELLTVFSGDAFNPSLESSVTKGSHMVDVLNTIGTDVACVGNHDLDFGVEQFQHLAEQCHFPWLLSNIFDPALGERVPLGNAKRTHMITTSNGIKVGFIGLAEREWLEMINNLPPGVVYEPASAVAKELVPKLREEGADMVICISHMREPNDNKLADETDGMMDIILGGHDHYYSHGFRKGTHLLRSGTDFKQLSYIEAWRGGAPDKRWDFSIWRRDVVSRVPEDEAAAKLVGDLTSRLQSSFSRPVGWTATPLDARFSTVRAKESNMGNFVCDLIRSHHRADCAMVVGGTFRGDQIYPAGVLRIKDIISCFPFEDPVVLLRATGRAIREALENGVSSVPALSGKFPQVSGITYEFDPSRKPHERITALSIAGDPVDPERKYTLATRGYMCRGKDGYTSLLVKSQGGEVEEIIDEEGGILLSTMLRQYFMALRIVGRWRRTSKHWLEVIETARETHLALEELPDKSQISRLHLDEEDGANRRWRHFQRKRIGFDERPPCEDDDEDGCAHDASMDMEMLMMRKFWARWKDKAGVKAGRVADPMTGAECVVDWTRVISPVLDGRIKVVG